MPNSLNAILGTFPNGHIEKLTDDELTKFLRERYRTSADQCRRDVARKRLDLYKDRGLRHFTEAVDGIYTNAQNRKWHRKFIELAQYQNLTKRLTNETAAVYSDRATRTVKQPGDKYKVFAESVRLDRTMRKANRWTNLLNNCLIWPDVRDDGVAVTRVVTTDKFSAVSHPNDPTRAVAYIVDQFPQGFRSRDSDPHHLVMTAAEYIWLDKEWRFVTRKPHTLGELPALLLSRDDVDDALLEHSPGNDVTTAHITLALLNAMLFKHQKSGTKMAIATGDTSGMARGQAMDEETVLEAPEGVAFQSLDLGANPKSYIDVARSVIKQISANYGIPESVFDLSYQATSGFEIELKRSALLQMRADQILDYRPAEGHLARLWSKVLTEAKHPSRFSADGFGIKFGDTDSPSSPTDKLAYWEALEKMGLANRVEMYLEMNPEATEEDAVLAIQNNLQMRIDRMRQFQSANGGGLFGSKESGDTAPTDRDGGRLSVVDDDQAGAA